jgi:uncharacterized membrane protein
MSKKTKHSNQHAKHQEKKDIVLGKTTSKRTPVILALVLVAAVAGIYLTLAGRGTEAEIAAASGGDSEFVKSVSYPLNMFDDGRARHFDYKDGPITVKYFILKSADGVVRAAFDACDVCWPAGKGYYQEGDVMVCRNCGRKFSSIKINEVKGGCNPAPLQRHVQGDRLVIDVADIKSGKAYFDFLQKG